MMAQRFEQVNVALTGEGCAEIHAFTDGKQFVTAWRPSPEELVKINLGEPIWMVTHGKKFPPVLLTADCPFEEAQEEKGAQG